MIVFHEGTKYSKEDMMQYYGFEDYADSCGDFIFIDQRLNFNGIDEIKKKFPGKKLVYLDIEEPNRFLSSEPVFRRDDTDKYFDKIFTVCPYTTKWLNKIQKNNKRICVFYPINEKCIPPKKEKIYDVIYIGNIASREIWDCIKTISKFNYRFVAVYSEKLYTFANNCELLKKIKRKFLKNTFNNDSLITNKDITFKEKLELLSKTKITIVHDLLFPRPFHIENAVKISGYSENEAFVSIPKLNFFQKIFYKLIGKTFLMPQLKTRLFEAAMCRSLILCRKDQWNEVERYFEPNKEFVYYEPDKLEEKIKEILENYADYQPMIERAFEKAKNNYTTKAFVEKFLKNIQI